MVVAAKNNVAVRGIGAVIFREIDTDKVLVTSTGSEFTINDNNEPGRIPFSDGGTRFLGEEYIIQKDETLIVSRDTYAAIEMAWRSFRVLTQQQNRTIQLPLLFEPTQVNNNDPKTDPENVFSFVADDADANASVKRNHDSITLTRQPFSSFDPNTDDSYAVGAGGAFRFSTNLINASISMLVPVTLPEITSLVEGTLPQYSVEATIFTTEGEIVKISIPRVSVSVDGTGLQPFQSPREQAFKIIRVPGQCGGSYTIEPLRKIASC